MNITQNRITGNSLLSSSNSAGKIILTFGMRSDAKEVKSEDITETAVIELDINTATYLINTLAKQIESMKAAKKIFVPSHLED